MSSRRIVIHFTRLRAYHLARLREAERACGPDVQGLAVEDHCGALPPDLPLAHPQRDPQILFPGSVPAPGEIRKAVCRALDELRPDAIAICGYATPDARECLRWARRHGARAILMTETRQCDALRVWWKEWIKSLLVRRFHGALCGGPAAHSYLENLGMPASQIVEGYDVVDNDYFTKKTQEYRTQNQPPRTTDFSPSPLPSSSPYFLASNRFIERKNVGGLIEAYAAYARRGQGSGVRDQGSGDGDQESDQGPKTTDIWPLVLLGDGELKPTLLAKCRDLGLQVIDSAPWESSLAPEPCPQTSGLVFFPGWRGHSELPRFYAHAGAFIHPARSEPWGLVINEAMASGLPILSSRNVGAAEVLVEDGVNGWIFDATDLGTVAELMFRISASEFPLPAFIEASRRILEDRCPARAFGESLARLLR